MNRVGPVIFICILLASLVGAQDAKNHLSIDAREVAGGTTGVYNWSTSWGSYDKTTYGSKIIEVSVRNLGSRPLTAKLTIYFVSAGMECGRATKDFEFRNQREIKTRIEAPVVMSREVSLPSINYRSVEGTLPVSNWFIIGKVDGEIFGIKASSSSSQTELEKMWREGKLKDY